MEAHILFLNSLISYRHPFCIFGLRLHTILEQNGEI